MSPSQITQDLPAIPTAVREARESAVSLGAECGASRERLDDIRLAVSEAATNVVLHAYPGQTNGVIHLIMCARTGHLMVRVEDDGCGLGGPSARPGLGVGRQIMRKLSDACSISERTSGGASVTLSFSFSTQ